MQICLVHLVVQKQITRKILATNVNILRKLCIQIQSKKTKLKNILSLFYETNSSFKNQ